jgi:hypothetical protein
MTTSAELATTWMEVIMSYFKVLSQHSPKGTAENYKKLQPGSQFPL